MRPEYNDREVFFEDPREGRDTFSLRHDRNTYGTEPRELFLE
jgi:hypothetical protein